MTASQTIRRFHAGCFSALLSGNMAAYLLIVLAHGEDRPSELPGLLFCTITLSSACTLVFSGPRLDRGASANFLNIGHGLVCSAGILLMSATQYSPAFELGAWFATALCLGVGGGLAGPARLHCISRLVGPPQVEATVGSSQALAVVAMALGPICVGLVLDQWSSVWVGCAATLLGLLAIKNTIRLSRARRQDSRPQSPKRALKVDSLAPRLRLAIASSGLAATIAAPVQILVPGHARQFLGLDPAEAGIFMALPSFGFALGAMMARKLRNTRDKLAGLTCSAALGGLALIPTLTLNSSIYAGMALICASAAMARLGVASSMASQVSAPPESVGRVIAINALVVQLSPAVAGLFVTGLTEYSDPATSGITTALGIGLVGGALAAAHCFQSTRGTACASLRS